MTPCPVSADHDLDRIVAVDQCCCDVNSSHRNLLHGFRRVVHEVGQGAFDGLGIGHHRGRFGASVTLTVDAIQPSVEEGKGRFHDHIDVRSLRLGGGKTRERGELIHQRAHCLDGAGDSVGAGRIICNDFAGTGCSRSRWRRIRSADNTMGVSGFLISCATRRATSLQAACFCPFNKSDKSSNTSTYPVLASPWRSVATVVATFSLVRCSGHSIWVVVVPMRSARRSIGAMSSITSSGKT